VRGLALELGVHEAVGNQQGVRTWHVERTQGVRSQPSKALGRESGHL